MKEIYLDHAATTPMDEQVFECMKPYFINNFGNADSLHSFGKKAKAAVDDARDCVANVLGAKAEKEVYFTSGGTESDNWALRGAAHALRKKGNHIIVSSIEHHAILGAAEELKKEGYSITFLPVTEDGYVTKEELEKQIRSDTVLVAIMYANNEVGTIQPICELAQVAHNHGCVFFTDAVQAAGALSLDVKTLNVDMLSFSSHKFYGPKGCGVLYVKEGTPFSCLIAGGEQEHSLRGGTTNVASVVGLAKALSLAQSNKEKNNQKIQNLTKTFTEKVMKESKDVFLNGGEIRLPSVVNLYFKGIDANLLLDKLDLNGVAVSVGSACAAGSPEPSHVLKAMNKEERAKSSLRFSFGKENTEEETKRAAEILIKTIKEVRGY